MRASLALAALFARSASIRSYTSADLCDAFSASGTCIIATPKTLACAGNSTPPVNGTALNVTAPALAAAALLASWPFPRDAPPADICDVVFNASVAIGAPVGCAAPFTCQLFLTARGADIALGVGIVVGANTVSVDARNLVLATDSKLTTTGLGLLRGPMPGRHPGDGGSSAGSGGALPCEGFRPVSADGTVPTASCCPLAEFTAFNDSAELLGGWSAPDRDWNYAFGSGGGTFSGNTGRSGGRLNVSLTGNLTIDGFLECALHAMQTLHGLALDSPL